MKLHRFPTQCANLLYFTWRPYLLDIPCKYDADGHRDCHYQTLRLNSVIFNSFVFMQVFSEINSRKITEVNVFENLDKSPIFCGILLATVVVQAAFIEGVGRSVVGPAIGFMNLTAKEWAVCLIIGSIAIPVGFIARHLPLEWFPGMTDLEADAQAQEAARKAVVAASVEAAQEKKDMAEEEDTSSGAAAATMIVVNATTGDVHVSVPSEDERLAAKKHWGKVKTFRDAYSALTSPLTRTLRDSRSMARGRTPSIASSGSLTRDDLGLGLGSTPSEGGISSS